MSEQPEKPDFWDGLQEDGDWVNAHHAVFQQGRNLRDAQAAVAKLNAGGVIPAEEAARLLTEFCYLVNAVGFLRAEYGRLRRAIESARELAQKQSAELLNKLKP